jgi:hypothetical protein
LIFSVKFIIQPAFIWSIYSLFKLKSLYIQFTFCRNQDLQIQEPNTHWNSIWFLFLRCSQEITQGVKRSTRVVRSAEEGLRRLTTMPSSSSGYLLIMSLCCYDIDIKRRHIHGYWTQYCYVDISNNFLQNRSSHTCRPYNRYMLDYGQAVNVKEPYASVLQHIGVRFL